MWFFDSKKRSKPVVKSAKEPTKVLAFSDCSGIVSPKGHTALEAADLYKQRQKRAEKKKRARNQAYVEQQASSVEALQALGIQACAVLEQHKWPHLGHASIYIDTRDTSQHPEGTLSWLVQPLPDNDSFIEQKDQISGIALASSGEVIIRSCNGFNGTKRTYQIIHFDELLDWNDELLYYIHPALLRAVKTRLEMLIRNPESQWWLMPYPRKK